MICQILFDLITSNAGEALYLTPYIESGRIAEGKELSRVVAPLDGLPSSQVVESYSGFLTVNKNTDSNIFFWFFPATVSGFFNYLLDLENCYFTISNLFIGS